MDCPECRYKCSNQAKLNNHIAAKHMRTVHGPPRTLLVCDSRVKSLKPRVIEKALRDGLLYAPGSLRVPLQAQGQGKGHPGRAYYSSRDWPNLDLDEGSFSTFVFSKVGIFGYL